MKKQIDRFWYGVCQHPAHEGAKTHTQLYLHSAELYDKENKIPQENLMKGAYFKACTPCVNRDYKEFDNQTHLLVNEAKAKGKYGIK